MSEPTPGPWHIRPYRGSRVHDRITSYTIEIDETDEYPNTLIGEIYGPGDESPDIAGNAALVGAAPDLLGALVHAEAVLSVSHSTTTNKGGKGPDTSTALALRLVRAALAKAKGEAS